MIVTVASFKGGVGKTTTAVHLAAYLQGHAKTLLIDADPNRSALAWAARGELPMPVVTEWQADPQISPYGHVVIDTPARPTPEDLTLILKTCDVLIIPTTPDRLALDVLDLTIDQLRRLGYRNYQILLTAIPPKPSRAGHDARSQLLAAQQPVLTGGIRRFAAFQKAAEQGVPVYAVKDPRAEAGWQDYVQVGAALLVRSPTA